jgi:hypothetical protein
MFDVKEVKREADMVSTARLRFKRDAVGTPRRYLPAGYFHEDMNANAELMGAAVEKP